MNMLLSAKSANPFIASLDRTFADADSPIKWLVLAHDDAAAVLSLSDAFDKETAAVLELSQVDWHFGSQQLTEAIEWAFGQGSIENLVLVGCSQSERADDDSSSEPMTDHVEATGYGRLLAGVQQMSKRNREVQSRFASRVKQLAATNVVRKMGNAVKVSGLFHRTEDGVLLAYETAPDCFRPLLTFA